MSNTPSPWDELWSGLQQLKEKWPGTDWSYDHRLKCVTSVIESAQATGARALLGEVMPTEWNGASIKTAPDGVRAIADKSGGLRGGQLLLWNGGPATPGAFGLWWPWGDGSSVSLRIGLHDLDLPKER